MSNYVSNYISTDDDPKSLVLFTRGRYKVPRGQACVCVFVSVIVCVRVCVCVCKEAESDDKKAGQPRQSAQLLLGRRGRRYVDEELVEELVSAPRIIIKS